MERASSSWYSVSWNRMGKVLGPPFQAIGLAGIAADIETWVVWLQWIPTGFLAWLIFFGAMVLNVAANWQWIAARLSLPSDRRQHGRGGLYAPRDTRRQRRRTVSLVEEKPQPTLAGLAHDHMQRLDLLLTQGEMQWPTNEAQTKVLVRGRHVLEVRNLLDGRATYRLNPAIADDVAEWRRSEVRRFMAANPRFDFRGFFSLFTADTDAHSLSDDHAAAARALGGKAVLFRGAKEHLEIKEHLDPLVEEVAGAPVTHRIIRVLKWGSA